MVWDIKIAERLESVKCTLISPVTLECFCYDLTFKKSNQFIDNFKLHRQMCTCCNILIDVEINHDNKSHWTNEMTQHIFVGPDSSSGQPYSGRRSSVRQQASGDGGQGLRPRRV